MSFNLLIFCHLCCSVYVSLCLFLCYGSILLLYLPVSFRAFVVLTHLFIHRYLLCFCPGDGVSARDCLNISRHFKLKPRGLLSLGAPGP